LGNARRIHRTCSIGLAAYPFDASAPDACSWEQVIDIADQCLYAAKRAGRNAWVEMLHLPSPAHTEQTSTSSGTQQQSTHFNAEEQIRLGRVRIQSSLPVSTQFDWSHGTPFNESR
jgi:predicted signal transduction protein with EAL and GGDEF domain